MTTRKYSSRSQQTTLAYAMTSSDTSMQVKSGSTLIPSITVGATDTYTVVIDPDTALEEIVDVSNWSSGNTLTVARGIDGSSAVSHAAGAVVRHMVTGRDLRESIRTIDAGTVTNTMLAGSIAPSKVTGTAVTAADTGTVTNTMLAGSIAGTKSQLITVATGSLSGASVTITIPIAYRRLLIFINGWSSTSTSQILLRLNNDSGSNYYAGGNTSASTAISATNTLAPALVSYATAIIELADQSTIPKMITVGGQSGIPDGKYTGTSVVSSIQLVTTAGTFDAGTYEVYGQ